MSEVIEVDQAWLAERSSEGPWYLDRPGATYRLNTDVKAAGTALVVIADDVILDLNGYEVVYDALPALEIADGSFEGQTSAANPPVWDFQNAPAASVLAGNWLANECGHGQRSLRFMGYTGTQSVVLKQSFALQADTQYSLSAMFEYGGRGSSINPGVKLFVRLTNEQGGLREVSWSGTNYRGIQFRETVFTTQSNERYDAVEAGIVVPETLKTGGLPVFIDAIQVRRTRVHGVLLGSFYWVRSQPADVRRQGNARRCVVRNGKIRQGEGGATSAHALVAQAAEQLQLLELDVTVQGVNSGCIQGVEMERRFASVRQNRLASHAERIGIRDHFEGAVVRGVYGEFVENQILRGPHAGYVGLGSGLPTRIAGNKICLQARYTNGFAIVASPGSVVEGNEITCGRGENAGRGILISGGEAGRFTMVQNNRIEVQQLPTIQEYEGRNVFGAYGIQLENASHVLISGNDVLARGEVHQAFALRINTQGGYQSEGLVIQENTFQAEAVAARAACLKIAGVTSGQVRWQGNKLFTNDGILGESDHCQVDFHNDYLCCRESARPRVVFSAYYSAKTERHVQVRWVNARFGDAQTAETVLNAAVLNSATGKPDERMQVEFVETMPLVLTRQGGPAVDVVVSAAQGELQGTSDQEGVVQFPRRRRWLRGNVRKWEQCWEEVAHA